VFLLSYAEPAHSTTQPGGKIGHKEPLSIPDNSNIKVVPLRCKPEEVRVLPIDLRKPKNREKHSPSLLQFCAEAGLQFTTEITLTALTRFHAQWKDGPISGNRR
jgi:hypothetical protein